MIPVLQFRTIFFLFIIFVAYFINPLPVSARVTPEDIINERSEVYNQKIDNYSQSSQDRLKIVSERITRMNQAKTDELSWIMETQGRILDEYETRFPRKNTKQVEEARYWITYTHEAVAYQAAKIYIFDISGESNLESDLKRTIGFFRSELDSARSKVIKSQQILTKVL
ncbi:hypothetical protein A3H85_02815 [Candidatus Daviesbacteria bacterium RIFCSPLOWO2_02_FULL_40_8]|uniref:Uncharacterized protein n=1 Tax=Candidatus Daviesbacteria bacterium RIFCSPLOWO2_01_FULL_40_24 TaxID=1797787 RepID=A0A1F5MIX3_9BACT|nr:MAG: hypothetical protein A2780_01475 [Candidatus Daviesbacteria bacterium RIFCSPHIGHO2_01_FULL_41_45]OGE34919.1 MAG: hypothetical protein A3C32_02800 [Candidatus Daviesbacteria bacterium RIFCSPHIGHO2_02_FULL_41_14]OGE65326.1 MAG: hypothetical protein A3B49_03515 [Candidatus Daviesbacteria bacterium RIFCSPLOWO2_01_FULL_40_24]OGE67123.1 MAG: hypothetical protein A3H85_02815 [Candidatus Daviesbacteria bacterium RIFCSPLOWO2_02_FULL_40_8]